MKTVFVTGSSGFLGSHFLVNFIDKEFYHAFVLVRGSTSAEREKKLERALSNACRSYLLIPEIDRILAKITIIDGDLSTPGFSINHKNNTLLQNTSIDQFWHFAASLNFENYRKEFINSTNVDGTLNAIDFASSINIKHFVYISTAYTHGAENGQVQEELHSLDRPFSNYYEESKCNAEHTVSIECKNRGMNYTIFRPSVVIGNSQTKRPAGSGTGLYGFIREIKRLKKAVEKSSGTTRIFALPDAQVNYIPIDILMNDIAILLKNNLPSKGIYHLAFDSNPSNKRVFEIITGQLGIKNVVLTKQDTDDLSALERLVAKKTIFYSSYLNKDKQFVRKIPNYHKMTEVDVQGYVVEAIKQLEGEDIDTTFSRRRLIASDGQPINLFVSGQHNKNTILICNAIGMPAEFIRPMADYLSNHYKVITWESRTLPSMSATGETADVSFQRHILDAKDIMDSVGIIDTILIGWCTGARLALAVSSNFPNSIKKTILLNGSYWLENCDKTVFEKNILLTMPKIAQKKKYAEFFHKSIFSRKSAGATSEEVEAQDQSNDLLSSTDPNLVHLTSIPFHSQDNLFLYARLVTEFINAKINIKELALKQPIYVITCTHDNTTNPSSSQWIYRNIANARFTKLVNEDHFALYRSKELFTLILDFIQEEQISVGSRLNLEKNYEIS